jgi:hypothetical protein
MTHYIDKNGRFYRVFRSLNKKSLQELRLKYLPAYPYLIQVKKRKGKEDEDGAGEGGDEGDNPEGKVREGTGEKGAMEIEKYTSKQKYTCPCGNNVWGRPGLTLICGECMEKFMES